MEGYRQTAANFIKQMSPFSFVLHVYIYKRPGITFPEATTSILLDSAADPNVCAFCYFLVYSGPFIWDLSLMKNDP